ncbi:MAG: hypothetical protein IJR95_02470 [Lachnospiraceae bacterium]|nr:hypothetical protein [Lachnospiraceae bacterium]
MKKLIVIVLTLSMLLSLAACGGSNTPSTTTAAATTTAAPADKTTAAAPATTQAGGDATTAAPAPSGSGSWETKGLPAIPAGCLSGEILITSVGQSTEADSVASLLKRAKIENYTHTNTVSADAVTSSYKVLIMVVGGSSKGLGGAGLDQAKETERVTAVIEKAKSLGLTIVCMHIGGLDRRGTMSDAFINLAFPSADYAIILKDGDNDDLMKNILAAKNVPTAYITKTTESRDVLAYMLGK